MIQEADTSLSCSTSVGVMGISVEGMVDWKEYVARVLHEPTVAYVQIRGTSSRSLSIRAGRGPWAEVEVYPELDRDLFEKADARGCAEEERVEVEE